MRSLAVLAALARRLNREAGAPPIPSLYFFTDPARTPDPLAAAAKLPRGAAVVFRHFGAADRVETARRLARLCRRRGLGLLIAADPALARTVGAGLHWPERLAPGFRAGGKLETAAAHSRLALVRASRAGFDAVFFGPVFPSRSPSAIGPLGPLKAGRLASTARLPVIALGGVTAITSRSLRGRGFAGIAAVEALL